MPLSMLLSLANGLSLRARRHVRAWVGPGHDIGATTLELVIIILGLIAVASLVVVAVTAAVQRRVDQIN